MSDQTIVCPSCNYEIKLTEAISAPIVKRLRKQFEADSRKIGCVGPPLADSGGGWDDPGKGV